jgi:hypothetical protein
MLPMVVIFIVEDAKQINFKTVVKNEIRINVNLRSVRFTRSANTPQPKSGAASLKLLGVAPVVSGIFETKRQGRKVFGGCSTFSSPGERDKCLH